MVVSFALSGGHNNCTVDNMPGLARLLSFAHKLGGSHNLHLGQQP